MKITDVPISDIKVRFRLRNPSDEKIEEIRESISQVGLINPVTIDASNNLLAGFHRLLAMKQLKMETIPSIIKDTDVKYGELVEVDENLKRNDLNHIEVAEHIVKREELMEELGMTYKRGDNQTNMKEDKMTVKDLAESIGYSQRSYQQRKQISNIHPEVKDLLVGTPFSESLFDLIKLSSEPDNVQKSICNLLITGKCKTWKMAFYRGKLADFKASNPPTLPFNIRERWGQFPKSLMKFDRSDDDLRKLCNLVNHDEDLRVVKGEINFGRSVIKLHQMSPNQCKFSLEYYTNEGDLICDPFNGRGTTAITSLYLNRRFVGFEINSKSFKITKEVVRYHMDVKEEDFRLISGCGCSMEELKDESEILDGVFSSPPYYLNAEPYSDDTRDLCNMSIEDFDEKIDEMFSNLSRLIKRSSYENRVFHPVIMVVGTARKGKEGIFDMSFRFQEIAKSHSFTLWDQIFVELNNPHLTASLQRNYELKFVAKNYESQLCWVKF